MSRLRACVTWPTFSRAFPPQVPATAAETVQVQLQGALTAHASLACWLTNATHHFIRQPGTSPPHAHVDPPRPQPSSPSLPSLSAVDVAVSASGSFFLRIPEDTVISLTTTTGQRKAAPHDVPASAPFPLPYEEHYDGQPGAPAKVTQADACACRALQLRCICVRAFHVGCFCSTMPTAAAASKSSQCPAMVEGTGR